MSYALSGIKVLEFSDFVSGPYCGRLLAGLGAEVIKIERPGAGDRSRSWGPFPADSPHPEKSGLFLFLNMNKKGVTLNVEAAAGKRIFFDLVKWANILIEDKPPAEMERLSFDYGCLNKINPSLVMTSITGFGQTGPYRDYRACGLISTHMSGMAFGNPAEGVDDPEAQPPLQQPGHTGDFMVGLSAGVCTLSAVLGQKRGGPGQHVDVSQQEALASVGRQELAFYVGGKQTPTRQKGRKTRGGILYPTKDGYVCLWAVSNDLEWQSFCSAIGNPEWTKRPEFGDQLTRWKNQDELDRHIEEWTRKHESYEVMELLQKAGVMAGPSLGPQEMVEDPHLKARGFFAENEHAVIGKLIYAGLPFRLSNSPRGNYGPAPLLGEHNSYVLGELLGMSRAEIEGLVKEKVLL